MSGSDRITLVVLPEYEIDHSSCLIDHAVFSCLFKMIPFFASLGPPMAGAFKRCFLCIHTFLFGKSGEKCENTVKDGVPVGFERFEGSGGRCFASRRNIEPSEFRRFYDRNDLPIQVHGPRKGTALNPVDGKQ